MINSRNLIRVLIYVQIQMNFLLKQKQKMNTVNTQVRHLNNFKIPPCLYHMLPPTLVMQLF